MPEHSISTPLTIQKNPVFVQFVRILRRHLIHRVMANMTRLPKMNAEKIPATKYAEISMLVAIAVTVCKTIWLSLGTANSQADNCEKPGCTSLKLIDPDSNPPLTLCRKRKCSHSVNSPFLSRATKR
jgi:hypothetical protein